jgi:hypothetical protein
MYFPLRLHIRVVLFCVQIVRTEFVTYSRSYVATDRLVTYIGVYWLTLSSGLYGIPESTPSHVPVDFSEILIPTFHLDGINQGKGSCPEPEILNF